MSMRNMIAMFGAMAMLRRIDQEEPLVLLYVRMGYLLYVGVTALIYIFLHFRILAREDTTLIDVPIAPKAPSFSEAMEQARKAAEKAEAERMAASGESDNQSTTSTVTATTNGPSRNRNEENSNGSNTSDEQEQQEGEEPGEKVETITVMEYDLRQLANSRRSWVTSSCFLAAVHYHMQSVSPLFMSAIMGVIRLLTEDPLVQIHLRGAPAVDKLSRPFTPEKNPLATMLKEFAPKDDSSVTAATNPAGSQATNNVQQVEDELHDDGDDDDDDDDLPAMNSNSNDDHIKSDFDDDDDEAEELSEKSKKDQ